METDAWTNAKEAKTKVKSILVDRSKLEAFIEEKRRYYRLVKAALDDHGIDYLTLEYDRDLKDGSRHLETLHKVETFLDMSLSPPNALAHVDLQKQSESSSLAEKIQNWEELKQWGYQEAKTLSSTAEELGFV
jgi:hypothetical protein